MVLGEIFFSATNAEAVSQGGAFSDVVEVDLGKLSA